jgi:hypothetical protein
MTWFNIYHIWVSRWHDWKSAPMTIHRIWESMLWLNIHHIWVSMSWLNIHHIRVSMARLNIHHRWVSMAWHPALWLNIHHIWIFRWHDRILIIFEYSYHDWTWFIVSLLIVEYPSYIFEHLGHDWISYLY